MSKAPVDTAHDYIGSLGSMTLWPDFGGDGAYGIPYVSVPFSQPLVPVGFDEAESDPGPYPIPPDAPVEDGGDAHVLTLRRATASRSSSTPPRARAPAARLQRRGVGPEVEQAAPRGLDLGRRRRAADPARARAPRGGRRRRHPPRAPHHRPGDPEGLHPPGDALGVEQHRHRPAADGAARPAQGGLRHQRPARPGARDRPGAQDLRRDRGRQRGLAARVRRRRGRPRLGRRGAERDQVDPRERARGRPDRAGRRP